MWIAVVKLDQSGKFTGEEEEQLQKETDKRRAATNVVNVASNRQLHDIIGRSSDELPICDEAYVKLAKVIFSFIGFVDQANLKQYNEVKHELDLGWVNSELGVCSY